MFVTSDRLRLINPIDVPKLQPFGNYDLAERIGIGAIGEVFRAISKKDGSVVALKRLMPYVCEDREVLEMLYREASIARSLEHPNIAKVVDAGEFNGVHFIAYAYVHGCDLRTLVERAARSGEMIPLDIALYVVMCVADALAYVHARQSPNGKALGLVHRDVSPSNILVSRDGDVKLTDFGIAYIDGRLERTPAGQIKGTFSYMSPEQATGGTVDGRSDIFSLGVCFWELVTGKRLFDGVRLENVLRRIASGSVESPRTFTNRVSPDLERIILKSLAQESAQRYADADQLHSDVADLARVENLALDNRRLAHYVRSLFPEVAAESAANV